MNQTQCHIRRCLNLAETLQRCVAVGCGDLEQSPTLQAGGVYMKGSSRRQVKFKMSLVPLLFRDWWDDFDRPSRLIDQHFGLGLRHHDLLHPGSLLRTGYIRPWRNLTRQESGTSSITADKEKFQVILDVQQFAPSEITVKTLDNTVIVEGKHEEKQDEHGYVARHFVRRYVLPTDIEVNDIVSSLSSDGILTVIAPKKALPPPSGERVVPIIQTGIPAVKPAEQPIVETPKEVKSES